MRLFPNWSNNMNKIDKLITQYCSDGVEYKALGELLDYEQPSKYIVKSTKYEKNGIPVLTAGKTFILGYTTEIEGIYIADKDNPVIIFDDFTTSFHLVDFSFKVKSSAIKILKPKNKNICIKYIYYAMNTINYTSVEHARKWISIYSNLTIPVPPLPVQEEIVMILDSFTSLETELEKALEDEVEARKKQYEYYRNQLLNFNENTMGIKFMQLGNIATIQRGKRLTKPQLLQDGIYPVFHGGIEPLGYYNQKNREHDTVMVINVGASAGTVGYSPVDFWSSDGCFCISHSKLFLNKYLYHILKTKEVFLQSKVRKAGIPTLDNSVVEKVVIPIPPLDEQKRIVEILDKFDSLINDVSESLTVEIDARKKQYEYYRNKLLTFKPLESETD